MRDRDVYRISMQPCSAVSVPFVLRSVRRSRNFVNGVFSFGAVLLFESALKLFEVQLNEEDDEMEACELNAAK